MEERLLRIQQGDTWALEILLQDEQDQPVDLTGATAKMQLRPFPSSAVLVAELSTENERIKIEQAGKIILSLSAEVTAALPVRSGVYDLEVKLSTGVVTKIIGGSYQVLAEVTR
ncbi:hypothetical protein GCM10007242_16400 [Pigmentiphaga litoralis]|uniref:hypothetical protein n=1 Tax=Pigmentiphaga litoralis TaxID=516702 RepID=UPI001679540A|nr:hypothetical protein [Pigmentiphaga litoralis]GGX11080.1 hypothetical protein GCM10007242_16400 [Pigmentiphaga litoralis]